MTSRLLPIMLVTRTLLMRVNSGLNFDCWTKLQASSASVIGPLLEVVLALGRNGLAFPGLQRRPRRKGCVIESLELSWCSDRLLFRHATLLVPPGRLERLRYGG